MDKLWQTHTEPPQNFFDEHPPISNLILSLLWNRSMRETKAIDEFLNPDFERGLYDPYLFQDMDKAVSRIMEAMKRNEKITIHGDYDADGVSASVILTSTFRAFGYYNTDVYLPHRETDGYGLNLATVKKLNENNTKLIITCDCGISNVKEVDLANKLGIDTIITDHHSIPKKLPKAYAIIHPKIEGETYPDQTLAGGGVAYKLMQGLVRRYATSHETLTDGQSFEGFEKWQLDMAAIASVADMVPLLGESRVLTKYGLIILNKSKRIGMKKLLLETKLMNEDGSLAREITPDTIGFEIAPRINAAGRMDHANVAYELFITDSPTRAVDLAFQLNKNNQDRKLFTTELLEKAIEQYKESDTDLPIIFIIGDGWPTGLNGLIASRMVEKFSKPTLVMSEIDGEYTGSARSLPYFNMIEAMQVIGKYFLKFGGHPMACGYSFKPDKLDKIRDKLILEFEGQTKGKDTRPILHIDAETTLESITLDLCYELMKLEPYGQGNPRPVFMTKGVHIKEVQRMGKVNSIHLKLIVYGDTPKLIKMIGWRMAEGANNWADKLETGDIIDIVYEVGINHWNNHTEVQLTIVDIRKSESINI